MGFITAVRGPDAARDPIKTCEGSPFNRWAAFFGYQTTERGRANAYKDTGKPPGGADAAE